MRGSELLRLVWLNINQNRFKAIMTSIGIVVGDWNRSVRTDGYRGAVCRAECGCDRYHI